MRWKLKQNIIKYLEDLIMIYRVVKKEKKMLPWKKIVEDWKGAEVNWYVGNGYFREISCHFVINTLYNPQQRLCSGWGNCTLICGTGC